MGQYNINFVSDLAFIFLDDVWDPVDITFIPALALIVLDDVRVPVDLPEEAILIARMLNYVDQKIEVKYDDEKKINHFK